MRRVAILALIGLAGCEAPVTPAAPTPELLKLKEACQAGNTDACAAVVQADQAAQARTNAAWYGTGYNYTPIQQQPYVMPAATPISRSPTTTNCTPNPFGGGMTCRSY
ncbi:hypothetical protein ACRARG_09510 [Pseudooceanicola sp. C21-150M6]|uniref:hypothetical protein n=1 Tax=Pseudooceanicola sp. C21-150M6 TaxID=3434355 RepID=UPI003D7F9041